MKKIYLILIIMIITAFNLCGQANIWHEDFSEMPVGWELTGNWSIANGYLEFNWNPEVENYDMTALSPVIEVSENTEDLIINQYVNQYVYLEDGEFFEISIIANGLEEVVWLHDENIEWGDPEGTDLSIPLADYLTQEIQIKFRAAGGNSFNINYWRIYQASITGYYESDMAAIAINGPAETSLTGTDYSVTVKNNGLNTQDEYTVLLYKEEGTLLDSVNGDIPLGSGETTDYILSWTPQQGGLYNIYGKVLLTGDEYPDNDQSPFIEVNVVNHYDLAVTAFIGDDTANLGVESEYMLHVQNVGTMGVSAWDITLMLFTDEDEILDAFSPFMGFLEPGDEMIYDLYWYPESLGEVTLFGAVEFPNDQNPADNISEAFTVTVFPEDNYSVDVGMGDNTNASPFNMNSRYSVVQTLYLEDEIDSAGFIDYIAFFNDFNESVFESRVNIYFGLTDVNELTNEFLPMEDMDLVFNGHLDLPEGENIIYIPLDTPYHYDEGNLVITVERIYNWHPMFGVKLFKGTFAGETRTVSVSGYNPIDVENPNWVDTFNYLPHTRFIFNQLGVGSLSGVVSNSESDPVANAVISVSDHENTYSADDNGNYLISFLYSGNYEVTASAPGYQSHSTSNVLISDDETGTADFTLNVSPANIYPPDDCTAEVEQRNNVILSWDEPQDGDLNDVMGYYIYRNNQRLINTSIDELVYHDLHLDVGSYTYFVTALYADGESQASAEVEVEITDHYIPRIQSTSISRTEQQVIIEWDILLRGEAAAEFVRNELIGYNFYRDGLLLNTEPFTPVHHNEYGDNTVENLTEYEYTVSAVYTTGESQQSAPVSIYTMLPPYGLYDLPSGSYLDFHWQHVDTSNPDVDLIGYNVTNHVMGEEPINSEPITDNFLRIEDLSEGDNLGLSVRAIYSNGESILSAIHYTEAGPSPIRPPLSLNASVDLQDVLLTWERPESSGNWLNYDSNTTGGEFGFADSAEFEAVIHLDNWDLVPYANAKLREVGFMSADADAEHTLLVWATDFMNPDEFQLLHEEQLSDIEAYSWNSVILPPSHMFTIYGNTTQFKIGIRYSNYSDFSAIYDNSANHGSKSDLIHVDGETQNLSDFQIDANWKVSRNIEVFQRDERNTTTYLTTYNVYRNNILIKELHHIEQSFTDLELDAGTYNYYVTARYDISGYDTIESEGSEEASAIINPVNVEDKFDIPVVTRLDGNYPNPFNPATNISFSIKEGGKVKIEVFNILGQRVATILDEELSSGYHSVVWDGTSDRGQQVGSGIYFSKMTTSNYNATSKMLLLK